MIGHDQQQQHGDRHGARLRPVAIEEELVGQQLGDHELVGAAEQRGDHVFTHGRDEHQQRAGDDARERQRQRHAQERADRAGAEIRAASSSVLSCFSRFEYSGRIMNGR